MFKVDTSTVQHVKPQRPPLLRQETSAGGYISAVRTLQINLGPSVSKGTLSTENALIWKMEKSIRGLGHSTVVH